MMKIFLSATLVCAGSVLSAQTPAPKLPSAPQPTVTMTAEGAGPKNPVVPPDNVCLTIGDMKYTAAQFDQIIDSLVPENYRTAAHTTGRKQMAENLARMIVLSQEGQKRKLDQTPTYKTQVQFQTMNILANLALE